jgi:hypothetical protein
VLHASAHHTSRWDHSVNRTLTATATVVALHVRDASYTNNWYGNSSCTDRKWTNGRCDWMSLGCHEFGHTADLGHRYRNTDTDNNSCMRDEIWPVHFDSHDIDSINSSV